MPELAFPAIGTRWSIESRQPIDGPLEARIRDRVEDFDRTYSRFRADSLVTAVAGSGGEHRFPDDSTALFDLYDRLFDSTEGAVTPLVGRSLERLGYDAAYSLRRNGEDLAPADWATEVTRDGALVTTRSPVLIDVGAAGKGYLVDLVGEILRENGVHEFVIDASGDLLVSETEPRRIALEHPLDPSLAIGVAELEHGSICASGSNRRVWGTGLHHIVDGRTGAPTTEVIATWAIAETALVADGLATALFFTEPGGLAEIFDFDYVRMFASGRFDRSIDFPGEMFR
ncbi:MAG TPA: FAD:protein FMN transferase [Lacisediminihabitans sp.]|uniref:FAD:protein FMN transferase n=1 Tax=Lacisediminihabitans sp. TaxID=2787631 RepID=UPI002ED92903